MVYKKAIRRSQLQFWRNLIWEVEKDPWGLDFKIVTKILVTRRRTPGLDDQIHKIARNLFSRVESFPWEDWGSCSVRNEELFTCEELKRASRRLKASTAPRIDGISNESLKDVIGLCREILLKASNSCLREGRFFADWKKQRLILLRKGEKPIDKPSSYRAICLLNTMGKLLENMILKRLQSHIQDDHILSENQFGFRKGRSTIYAIQMVVDIATEAKRGTGKRKGFCALISIDIRNAFNSARWKICIETMMRKKVPDYLLRMRDNYLSGRLVI